MYGRKLPGACCEGLKLGRPVLLMFVLVFLPVLLFIFLRFIFLVFVFVFPLHDR